MPARSGRSIVRVIGCGTPDASVHQYARGQNKVVEEGGSDAGDGRGVDGSSRSTQPSYAVVSRGDQRLLLSQQGLTVLGAPVGHVAFVCSRSLENERLLRMVPTLKTSRRHGSFCASKLLAPHCPARTDRGVCGTP